MNASGLTDLSEDAMKQLARCRCGSLARIGSGLCVSCLLRTGLMSEESTPAEDFDALLAAVDVPDRDWQLGNYRILEEIGRGGMGVIYRARHVPSQRIVALKRVLNYHSDSNETMMRFQREAIAAASLDHPNILPIYDVGTTDDGLPFFSMKFAAGGSLLESRRTFQNSPRRAVELIATVARAVDHAHKQGILHRDLKPGNILLDARGAPLVSDFGLAKWLETTSDLTRTLTVFGTPGYIAPEQSATPGAALTPATDVYSIGAILFELLAGRPPFLGEHAVAVIRQAAENDAPKLRSVVSNASRDLETICARCLEREPGVRYRTAADLAEDLERWLEGRPINARPISPAAKLYRWSRRNPILGASVAACLVFAGALISRQVQSWRLENKIRENELARNSIALLPFVDLDSATQKPEWTAAFTQDLQADLSSIGTARIIPAHDAGDAATTARKLHARTALFGTHRQTDHGTEISIQLISPDGDVLFNRLVDLNEPTDLKSVTRGLAAPLLAVLTAKDWSTLISTKSDPGMRNERSRELIAAGRELTFHYTVRDLDRAINCFEKAITIEPRSALAHAYLAGAAGARTHYLTDTSLLRRAKQEIEEALRLAPNSAEVLRMLAGTKYQQGQLRSALADGLRAFETAPPDAKSAAMLGMIYHELGRPDLGIRWLELASRFGSRAGEYECDIGDRWAALGDYEKAQACYLRANDLHPERSEGLIGCSRLSLLSANFAEARKTCQQSANLTPERIENIQLAAQIEFFARNLSEAEKLYNSLEQKDDGGGGGFYGGVTYKSALGWLALSRKNARLGNSLLREGLEQEDRQLAIAPDNPDTLYRIAAVESALGESESAVAHLEAAVSNGWIDYRSLSLDPRFDTIANDDRFQMILGRLKLKVEELRRAMTDQ